MLRKVQRVQIPLRLRYLFDPPLGSVRFRGAYGGRGSAKSWSFARALLILGAQQSLRILCVREFQTSIRESVHRLLKDQIRALNLDGHYTVLDSIIRGRNGTEFLFKGLHHNVQEIKSTEGVDICWVEEAESVSKVSWRVLTPTIRKPKSEIWVSFNPHLADDPTYVKFVTKKPKNAIIKKIGWKHNPWLPAVLYKEAMELRNTDREEYDHVWGGEPWMRSDEQVLGGKWELKVFTPTEGVDGWGHPLFGHDYGFSNDPASLTKVWIKDDCLYVEYEARGMQWDTSTYVAQMRNMPGAQNRLWRGDSSRPETINELRLKGFNVISAAKWAGSVEDGISHLRSYKKIYIHPRCQGAYRNGEEPRCGSIVTDAKLWRYKTDPRTGDVLPILRDGDDHGWDSVRYALSPLIKQGHRVQWKAS